MKRLLLLFILILSSISVWATEVQDTIYLIGEFTGWKLDSKYILTRDMDNGVEYTGSLYIPKGLFGFKIYTGKADEDIDWSKTYGMAAYRGDYLEQLFGGDHVFLDKNGGNILISNWPGGDVAFKVDLEFWRPNVALNLNGVVVGTQFEFCDKGQTLNYCVTSSIDATCEVSKSDVSGFVMIPKTVDIDGRPFRVTKIADNAFSGCSELFSVTICSNIKAIGDKAFADCNGLTSVILDGEDISIGDYIFSGCESLKKIACRNSLKYIIYDLPPSFDRNSGAFSLDHSLGEDTDGRYIESWSSSTGWTLEFVHNTSDPFIIDDKYQKIGPYAFSNCSDIPSISIPYGISSIGQMAFYGCTGLTTITLPESITSIDPHAFSGCTGLTTITLPESITSIGNNVFSGCSSITSITIPKGVKYIEGHCFKNCSSLTSIQLPTGLETIRYCAFLGCSSLTSITIPEGVKDIWSSAFSCCTGLKELILPESLQEIWSSAFEECRGLTHVRIPKSVRYLGKGVFYGCDNLHELIYEVEEAKVHEVQWSPSHDGPAPDVFFPSSIEKLTIGENVKVLPKEFFNNLNNLKELRYDARDVPDFTVETIPFENSPVNVCSFGEAVHKIPAYLLYNCDSLNSLVLSDSVVEIGSHAFEGATALTKINFGKGLETIGQKALRGCIKLNWIIMPPNLRMVEADAFSGCDELYRVAIPLGSNVYAKIFTKVPYVVEYDPETTLRDGEWLYNNNKTVIRFAPGDLEGDFTIPTTIIAIDKGAFAGLKRLNSVQFPNGLLHIGDDAFRGCTNIETIDIPQSVTYFSGFRDCTSLKSVTLPDNLEYVGNYALTNCTSLTDINILAPTIKAIGADAFANCVNLPIQSLPDSLEEIYPSAFLNCKKLYLADGNLPKNLRFIQNKAFSGCTGLREITIPENLSNIGNWAFDHCALSKLKFNAKYCYFGGPVYEYSVSENTIFDFCNSVEFGEEVKRIPDFMFTDSNIGDIRLPDGIEYIGNYAFAYCQYLTSINLPSSLKELYGNAFVHSATCYGMKYLEYNVGIKSIPFYGMEGQESLFGNIVYTLKLGENTVCPDIRLFPYNVTIEDFIYEATDCDLTLPPMTLNSITIGEPVRKISEKTAETFRNLKCETLNYLAKETSYESEEGMGVFNSGVKTVNIGDSVSYIAENTFKGLTGLQEVNASSLDVWMKIGFGNEYANPVYYAKGLTIGGNLLSRRVTLPEGLKEIKPYSFINCKSILSITLPESLEHVADKPFYGCEDLQLITFPSLKDYLEVGYASEKSRVDYGNDAQIYVGRDLLSDLEENGIDVPQEIKHIPDYAFFGREALNNISMPSTVESIGRYAFGNCKNMSSPLLPESLVSLGDHAFSNCLGINEMNISDNVEMLPDSVFSGCANLTKIIFTDNIHTIGKGAFAGCEKLESVQLPDKLRVIGEKAFFDAGIKSMWGSGNIKSVGAHAFGKSTSDYQSPLIDIQNALVWSQIDFENKEANPIHNSGSFTVNGSEVKCLVLDPYSSNDSSNAVRSAVGEKANKEYNISPYAFHTATNLEKIRVKGHSIGERAFYGCKNVGKICLDTDVVGKEAFADMDNLKEIYCLTSTPPEASDDVFSEYRNITLYVPIGATAAYENSSECWWRFLDIRESDFGDIYSAFSPDYQDEIPTHIVPVNNSDLNEIQGVYNMEGIKVASSTDNLAPGLYIIMTKSGNYKLQIK